MKKERNKTFNFEQQCRSFESERSARLLSFEDRQRIAFLEARRNGYDSADYICEYDRRSVFCAVPNLERACTIGLPAFIEVFFNGEVRSSQSFEYMDLIEDDLDLPELISKCHYYKGEEVNPFDKAFTDGEIQNKAMIWKYERFWILEHLNEEYHPERLSDYLSIGLRHFESEDKVPVSLKALLFNRFCKMQDRTDPEAFKTFYRKYYNVGQPQQ